MEDDEPGCPYSNETVPGFSPFLYQYTAPRRPIVLNAMIGQAHYIRLDMPQPEFRLRLFHRLTGAGFPSQTEI